MRLPITDMAPIVGQIFAVDWQCLSAFNTLVRGVSLNSELRNFGN